MFLEDICTFLFIFFINFIGLNLILNVSFEKFLGFFLKVGI